ncbi:MAG: hypothetical protein ICV71_02365 [Thermoleophilia bacterium]|nr:hypothetical protein [Thermoleophilia bacterium]
MDEQIDNRASETASGARVRDYDELGERVASVLNAAEQAAEQIRADAMSAAEQTRRDAEAEARSYAEERRREADVESERRRSEALAEATSIRDGAQAAARRIAEEGQRHLRELREDARALERRFVAAIDDLRDLVSEVEEAVPNPGEGDHRDVPDDHAAGVDPAPRNLNDALRPGGREEAEARVEAGADDDAPAPYADRPPRR